jgi:hypothetical protein
MGRYYDGDIDGKWWFGVQSSTTPEKFGAEPIYSFIEYTICNNDDFTDAMDELKKGLGDKIKILDEFFDKQIAYSDNDLLEYVKKTHSEYTKSELGNDLSCYADYKFGLDVAKHFKESGEDYCSISSEL